MLAERSGVGESHSDLKTNITLKTLKMVNIGIFRIIYEESLIEK